MQQNLGRLGAVEVPGPLVKQHVRQPQGRCDQLFAKIPKLERQQDYCGKNRGDQSHREKRRGQPADPAQIEPAQRQGAGLVQLGPKNAADQKAGYDEKDVDTDKPAAQIGHPEMIQHNGQHRDGP